jgi:hypothetical protein
MTRPLIKVQCDRCGCVRKGVTRWMTTRDLTGSLALVPRVLATMLLMASLLIAGCGSSSHPATGYFNMQELDLAIHNRQVEQEDTEKETGAFGSHGFLYENTQGPGYHYGVHCIATSHQSAVCELIIERIQDNPEEYTEGHCRSNNISRCSVITKTPKTLSVTIAPDGKSFVVR